MIRFGHLCLAVLSLTLIGACSAKPSETCIERTSQALLFWIERPSLKPGQSIALTPAESPMPGMYEPLTASCVANVSVTPKGAAKAARNEHGQMILTLTEQAEPGTRLLVKARYDGNPISGSISVIGDDVPAIAGLWKQDPAACPAGDAILEADFRPDGEFSITWRPFEVYKDYWGTYRFDEADGQLSLDVVSGNYIPDDVQSGTVMVEGDTLTLNTASFGSDATTASACPAPFTR